MKNTNYSYIHPKGYHPILLIFYINHTFSGLTEILLTGQQGPLLLTWINFNTGMDEATCPVKCGMKSLIHSKTSTVVPNFNGAPGNYYMNM